MTFFLHVSRNIGRNKGRTLAVILVVGVTLGIFLVLGQVSTSVVSYTNQVVGSVPNIVTVQPAGGTIGGGLTEFNDGSNSAVVVNTSALDTIYSTQNVVAVQRVYFASPNAHPGGGEIQRTATGCSQIGNQYMAEDTTSTTKLLVGGLSGATVPTITFGRDLNAGDENSSNAIIGQQYATDNHLYVGDELTIGGHVFHVVGVFAGSGCQGDIIIMPYSSGLSTLNATNPQLVYIYVDSYQNVNTVVSSLQNSLGSLYSVENLASVDHNALSSAISSILFSSQFGEYAALSAGAATVVIVMILVTSRRTREVGVLKALGYGGVRILGQITAESLILAVVGFPIALIMSLVIGPSVAQDLLGNIQSPVNPFLKNISFALTPEILLIGVGITLAFGLIGALYPAIKALRLRPTEALRHE